jgi:hypothetical protein
MATNYANRMLVPLHGDATMKLYSVSKELLCTGYKRIVIGQRGPYVEIEFDQLNSEAFNEMPDQHYYYVELRSTIDNVKAYFQLKEVDYADYKIGLVYISPFDLALEDNSRLIIPVRATSSNQLPILLRCIPAHQIR